MAISHKNIPDAERHNPKGFDGASGGTVLKKVNTGDAAPTYGTVKTVDIQDLNVTTAKIADGALTADATGRAKMANGYITAAQMSANSVTTSKILDNNVLYAKLSVSTSTGYMATGSEAVGGDNPSVTIPASTFAWWVVEGSNTGVNKSNIYRSSQTLLKMDSTNSSVTVGYAYFN